MKTRFPVAALAGMLLLPGSLFADTYSVSATFTSDPTNQYGCANTSGIEAQCMASTPGATYVDPQGLSYDLGGGYAALTTGREYPYTGEPFVVDGNFTISAGGFQNIAEPYQPTASFKDVLNVPVTWGNVLLNGFIGDQTNQYGSHLSGVAYQIDLTTSDGQKALLGDFVSSGSASVNNVLIHHVSGQDLSLTLSGSYSCCGIPDGVDNYAFRLFLSDAGVTAAPEPATFRLTAMLVGLLGIWAKARMRRR